MWINHNILPPVDRFDFDHFYYCNQAVRNANEIGEVESIKMVLPDIRQKMVDILNKDNGKGGTAPENNREHYGSTSKEGTVVAAPDGPIAKPDAPVANLTVATDKNTKSIFHGHESASATTVTGSNSANSISFTTISNTVGFAQAPSYGPRLDINKDNVQRTNYVFGRGNGVIYMILPRESKRLIPQKYFVTPKQ